MQRRFERILGCACMIMALTLGSVLYPGSIQSHVAHAANPQIMFGMGTEADGDRSTALVSQAPVKMLTSWFNRSGDLAWMSGWQNTEVPNDYAAGYAMHLVVYSGQPSTTLSTPYGPACGQAYPLSAGFLSDMTRLAQIFRGSGPLYVSLFAEFQTYACNASQWTGSENYWNTLKDQYRKALAIFHQYAPNSHVGLCWGGWQTRWDVPSVGAGRSFFQHFADVMSISDFQSFQAMNTDTNVTDVQNMTATLHQWGPVMLAYYKPNNNSQAVFDADTQAMLTSSFLGQAAANGLFAFGFMDSNLLNSSATSFNFVKNAVTQFGVPRAAPANGLPFKTGFESSDMQPSWNDTVDFASNVTGICCGLTHAESSVRQETAHSGSAALMYSGMDTSTSQSFSYNKILDVHTRNLTIGSSTTLSYWIYPQNGFMGAVGSNSTHVAIEIIFTDGSNLRDSGVVDQYGVRLHPQYQGDGGHLIPNQWNFVSANIGARESGKIIDHIVIGYDHPGGTGAYRGYLDDITIQ